MGKRGGLCWDFYLTWLRSKKGGDFWLCEKLGRKDCVERESE